MSRASNGQSGQVNPDLVITIDGPAGSGKSTAARMLAVRLGARFLESGALYRCVAFKARMEGVELDRVDELARLAATLQVRFESDSSGGGAGKVFVGGREVSAELRSEQVSLDASVVAALPEVRKGLLDLQHRLARGGIVVVEGRDLGTVVFPDARVKFFVEADPEVRAQRRFDEQVRRGQDVRLEDIRTDLEARDLRDRKRKVAPLKPASDAVVVDTTRLSPGQVVDQMLAYVRKRTNLALPD